LRRIVSIKEKNNEVEIFACVTRKNNKEGAKLKDISFTFDDRYSANWANLMEKIVFGGPQITLENSRSILILLDKNDSKEAARHIDKLMKPVFDAANRALEVKRILCLFL
jgi:hypothetical protein